MNVQETLDTLKALGTEQNRKIYRRHGAVEDVYGVSYVHLKDLKKKIKVDHDLAEGLWGKRSPPRSGSEKWKSITARPTARRRTPCRTSGRPWSGKRNPDTAPVTPSPGKGTIVP